MCFAIDPLMGRYPGSPGACCKAPEEAVSGGLEKRLEAKGATTAGVWAAAS